MTWKTLHILAVVLCSVTATKYSDCGSLGSVSEFKLTGCEVPPCIVNRPPSGSSPSTYTVDITFTPGHDSSLLATGIIAGIGNIDVPWPGPDGCNCLLEDQCPIKEGKEYHYHAEFPVLATYPAIDVLITWTLEDENSNNQVCLQFPITLV
ncbi:unnamed protein product [Meganyctiphanes norvegica]|uniref:MD-2-related lipid-recognition domain-containing protein n=1 Tax=Meganyctiphanes norvegica TaxID=48144 RepID=A0AAV2R8W9_MEGNR